MDGRSFLGDGEGGGVGIVVGRQEGKERRRVKKRAGSPSPRSGQMLLTAIGLRLAHRGRVVDVSS